MRWITAFAILFSALAAVRRSTAVWAWRRALGVRFLDADGQVLVANGGNLARVASIEMDECDPRLANCHIEVACDVDNPLVGARGAAAGFGRQKGQRRKWSKSWNRGCKITPVFYNSKLKSTSARWRAAALRAVWVLRRRYFSECGY